MKTCSKCREDKPLNDFNRDSGKRDGRKSYCRPCGAIYRQKATTRGDQSEYWTAWYAAKTAEDPLYGRISQGRKRAHRAGSPRVDIFDGPTLRQHWRSVGIDSDRCYHCGDPVDWQTGDTRGGHLDHLTPLSAGGEHTVSNLVPSCPPCNQTRPRVKSAVA